MIKYCDNCRKLVDTELVSKNESFDVFDETISIKSDVLVCKECKEELFDEELDNTTLINVFNEYRRRYNLLFPEEIKKIRKQYGLSQEEFAKMLNLNTKDIVRYENGSLQPREVNNLLLKMMGDR